MEASVTTVRHSPGVPRRPAAGEVASGRRSPDSAEAERAPLVGEGEGDRSAPATGLAPSGDFLALPLDPAGVDQDLQEFLDQLRKAPEKMKQAVAKAIQKAEDEADEAAKIAKRKEVEKKAEAAQVRLKAMAAKARMLTSATPEQQGKVAGKIEAALEAVRGLMTALDDVDLSVEAGVATLDEKLLALETAVEAVDQELRQMPGMADPALMAIMFGPNWDQTIAPNAFANGYLGVEDIAEDSAAMKAFESYRLVALDGITEEELRTIATAKRHSAIFLGGSLEAGAVKESDVNAAIDQIFALAEKGELTRGKLNDLLAPFGVKFTRAAFEQVFAGGGGKAGVLPVCKSLGDMFLTAVFVQGGNEYDAAALLDPAKAEEMRMKGIGPEALAETFKEYGRSSDFFVIQVGGFSELYQGALAARYGLSSELTPAQLLVALHDQEGIPEWLKKQIAAIKDKAGLSDAEKWNQLTLAMLGRVFGKLRVTPQSSRQEAEVAKLKDFRALVEAVQSDKATPSIRNAFIGELTAVVLDGQREVFEWSPIVRGKGVVQAIPGVAPAPPAVTSEGGES